MKASWIPFLAMLAVSGPHAGIYRWTDAEGNVHFSQTPPPDIQAEPVTVHPPPPSSGQPNPELEKATEAFDQWYAERKKREAEAAKKRAEQRQRKANCEKARRNLATITSRGRVKLIKGDEAVALTEEERQALIADLRKQVETFCTD